MRLVKQRLWKIFPRAIVSAITALEKERCFLFAKWAPMSCMKLHLIISEQKNSWRPTQSSVRFNKIQIPNIKRSFAFSRNSFLYSVCIPSPKGRDIVLIRSKRSLYAIFSASFAPPRMWKWRCGTVWHASLPQLEMTR